MKKTYIAPSISAIAIETHLMIAVSNLMPGAETPKVTVTNEEFDGEFSARGGDFDWDDEENY